MLWVALAIVTLLAFAHVGVRAAALVPGVPAPEFPQFQDTTCAACGHAEDWHDEEDEGCMDCPERRKCMRFIRRGAPTAREPRA